MTVEDLVGHVRPLLPDPVDELQVAAVLESQGVTDDAAVDEYGMADVFELAHEVYASLKAEPAAEPEAEAPPPSRPWWQDVVHGLVYLIPSVVYPAVLAVLGAEDMLYGLVFATTTGWIWGAGTSWVAHRMVGAGARRAAARTLLLLNCAGFAPAFAGALLIARWHGGGTTLVLFVLAQTGFQVAAGILVFHRREAWLLAAMLPAAIGGLLHLLTGFADGLVVTVLALGVISVAAALTAAHRAGAAVEASGVSRVPPVRELVLGALPGMVYAALCAGFLLHADMRYVIGPLDLAVGVTPLVAGMGAVEWRVHRMFEQASRLLRRCASPALFHRAMWRLLLRELATCLVVLGALALVLLAALRWSGELTVPGALLIDAHVVLGGAFFLGFVLIRTGGPGWAVACLVAVLPADVLLVALADGRHGDVPVFLGCCAALSILLLAALHRSVGQVRHYR
ncbi:hypothetical protein [Saccharothrix obliqua]|uniref:hypothetical protein n=1 Tax=Saccharothrix obliqua TaxID=2861747 RepID=UPI001C5E1071|nr:hypothetical protein [Saccharothrix obliqua]MBW4718086.1 hypothetical protein [Saccharothrix obliqua]